MDQYYNRYNTAKGVRFVALGFLFLFLDLNIIADSFYIDILPDAVGLIFFLISVRYLEGYVKHPTNLRLLIAFLLLEDIAEWFYNMSSGSGSPVNQNDMQFLFFLASLVYAVFVYRILDAMIRVAVEYRSMREHNIRVLRVVLVIIQIAFSVLWLIPSEGISPLAYMIIIAGFIGAIANLVVLFGLKKDVENVPKSFFDDFEAGPDFTV